MPGEMVLKPVTVVDVYLLFHVNKLLNNGTSFEILSIIAESIHWFYKPAIYSSNLYCRSIPLRAYKSSRFGVG